MKFQMKAKKSSVTAVITAIAAVSMLSSVIVIGLQSVKSPSDNPWDYTMLTIGKQGALTSNTDELSVMGDVRSNGNISMSGNKLSITGNAVAMGEVVIDADDREVGRIKDEASEIAASNVFDRVFHVATEGFQTYYMEQLTEQTYEVTEPIISNSSLSINVSRSNLSSSTEASDTVDKFGAFGTGFLTKVYENPNLWSTVLPVFSDNFTITPGESGHLDVLELGQESAFIPVSSQSVSETWENTERLAGDVFQQYFSQNAVAGLISDAKAASEVFSICSEDSVQLHCGYDNSAINPILAENASSITTSEGNLALNGEYSALEEIRLDNWGGSQLIGSYPNLKYIYKTSWGNLNLAGDFPSLEGVYLPGGQLLLGNGDYGFSASNADFIDENGIIIVYTANDVNLTNCRLMTNQTIVMRGSGNDAETSKFNGYNSLFAAGGALAFEDVHDNLSSEMRKIPVFYSYAPMSFVNSSFELLQGCFISANGAMVLTETSIQNLRGYLLSPYGINEYPSNSSASVWIDTYSYNIPPNIRSLNTQQNGIWHLGNVAELSYAPFPETLASEICNISDFLDDCRKVKNDDGEYEEVYQIGSASDQKGILDLNSAIIAEGDIRINAEQIVSTGNEKHVIASKNGDVVITVLNDLDVDCIIYAPNGKVTIDGSGTIRGRIFAREIELIGENLTIIGGDEDISDYGFIESKQEESTDMSDSETMETDSSAESGTDSSEDSSSASIVETSSASETIETDTSYPTETSAQETDAQETETSETEMNETSPTDIVDVPDYTNAEYVYDKLGRLIKVIYDDSHYVEYQYDANGNIVRVEKSEEE